jgi:hypothetical protein
MRRREFITLLGEAAAWPLAVRAQQAKVVRLGYLDPSSTTCLTQRRHRGPFPVLYRDRYDALS